MEAESNLRMSIIYREPGCKGNNQQDSIFNNKKRKKKFGPDRENPRNFWCILSCGFSFIAERTDESAVNGRKGWGWELMAHESWTSRCRPSQDDGGGPPLEGPD